MAISKKDLKILKDAGWTQNPNSESHWYDPLNYESHVRGGGINYESALEDIRDRNRWNSGKSVFRVERTYQSLYGYKVVQINPDKSKIVVFRHELQDICFDAESSFSETGKFNFDGIIYLENVPCLEVDEYPALLVLHEKHGNRYYYIPTFESLKAAAHEIVMQRIEDDYWYYKPEKEPTPPKFPREMIKEFPTKSIQEIAQKDWDNYDRELKDWKYLVSQQEQIKKIKKGDTLEALRLLMYRNDKGYQYEQLEFETMNYVEPK